MCFINEIVIINNMDQFSSDGEGLGCPIIPGRGCFRFMLLHGTIEDRILPPSTNQHTNRILKVLADDAQVDPGKLLTFHLSRHTCAQLQYEAEILERTTGAWLGQVKV